MEENILYKEYECDNDKKCLRLVILREYKHMGISICMDMLIYMYGYICVVIYTHIWKS